MMIGITISLSNNLPIQTAPWMGAGDAKLMSKKAVSGQCHRRRIGRRNRPSAVASRASRREILQQLWIGADVMRRSCERNRAAVQYVSVTGNPQRELKMLLDDDDGDLFCQKDQPLGNFLDDTNPDALCRFVQQQHPRIRQ